MAKGKMAAFEWADALRLEGCLNEEERAIRDAANAYAQERLQPRVLKAFREESFDRAIFNELGELGFLGATLPSHGCADVSYVAYGLISREIERVDSGYRSAFSVQSSLCMYPVYTYGSEAQKERFLPSMARGETIGCFGLTEAHGGSDPANMKTHAKRRGGDWVINGSKMWITNAPIADLCIAWAMTEDGVRGFLVEKGTRGFTASEIHDKFSLRALATGALFFDEVVVPEAHRLPGAVGLKAPLSCLTQARYGIAWGVIGAAQACLAQLIDYTKTRVLFGRPLAANQLIQVRLAEMARKITTAQLLVLQLGRLKDRGAMTPAQVSLAKWNNVRAALDIARDCRDMLGGAGISAEYAPIRHMLNLESVVTYEGTESIHQLSIGRELTGISAF